MAVMGIDETNARLRDGNDYSYMIAGLVYVSRIVTAEALLPSLDRENQGEADFEAFLEQRKEFLADGSMSVMGEMLSLLAYGKKIAKNFHAQGEAALDSRRSRRRSRQHRVHGVQLQVHGTLRSRRLRRLHVEGSHVGRPQGRSLRVRSR
ncbi:unnamed protein product [Aureobasidium mustum]|nr:unnamed protein product [Aureobasidium mustum]